LKELGVRSWGILSFGMFFGLVSLPLIAVFSSVLRRDAVAWWRWTSTFWYIEILDLLGG